MFITFEGPDGAGKTTAIKQLKKFLKKNNVDFFFTREPGTKNSRIAKRLREIVLDKDSEMSDMVEAILYTADRRLNLEKNIWPNLKKNKLVLCDRYFDSTFAYQGSGRQLGLKEMIMFQEIATEKTYPDITIFFDVPPEISKKRLNRMDKDKDRLELAGEEFHKNVYKGYQKLVKMFPNRFRVIDATKSQEEVFKQVKQIFEKEII